MFAELSALHLHGQTFRWAVVALVQIIKAGLRLLLLLRHGRELQCSPAVPPLDRRTQLPVGQGDASRVVPATEPSYALRHSGRVIRTLAASPPASRRQWKPPGNILTPGAQQKPPTPLQGPKLAAELAHILRPLVHRILELKCWHVRDSFEQKET